MAAEAEDDLPLSEVLASLDAPIVALLESLSSPALDFPLAERQAEAPATLADAQALAASAVQRDSHGRTRVVEPRVGASGAPKCGCLLTGAFPDARAQPFLAWTEEFFRHVRREDLDSLLRGPGWPGGDVASDPAFAVPPLGDHFSATWQQEDVAAAQAAQAAHELQMAAKERSAALAAAQRAAARQRAAAAGPRRTQREDDAVVTTVSPFEPGTDPAELCHVCMDGER